LDLKWRVLLDEIFADEKYLETDFYEPNCIATMSRLLRRTLVHPAILIIIMPLAF
jgi:hypothetical protein